MNDLHMVLDRFRERFPQVFDGNWPDDEILAAEVLRFWRTFADRVARALDAPPGALAWSDVLEAQWRNSPETAEYVFKEIKGRVFQRIRTGGGLT